MGNTKGIVKYQFKDGIVLDSIADLPLTPEDGILVNHQGVYKYWDGVQWRNWGEGYAAGEISQSEIENTSTTSTAYVSGRRFWQGITKFLSLQNIWTALQRFRSMVTIENVTVPTVPSPESLAPIFSQLGKNYDGVAKDNGFRILPTAGGRFSFQHLYDSAWTTIIDFYQGTGISDFFATKTELEIKRRLLSCGMVTMPTITSLGSGAITISSSTVRLNTQADFSGDINEYTVPALTVQLVANQFCYITVNAAGTPTYSVITDNNAINHSNILSCFYGQWLTLGGLDEIKFDFVGKYALGTANNTAHRLIHTERFGYESGLQLSEYGTRNISILAGRVWYDGNEINTLASLSASANNEIYHFYPVGGVYTVAKVTQYPNTVYNNGTELVAINGAKYVPVFIWKTANETDNNSFMVVGAEYNSVAEALAASLPASIPDIIGKQGKFLGRIVIKNGEATASKITFEVSGAVGQTPSTEHNSMSGRDLAGNHAKLVPLVDGTTAIQITKADGTTALLNFDTTNSILTSSGQLIVKLTNAQALDVQNASAVSVFKVDTSTLLATLIGSQIIKKTSTTALRIQNDAGTNVLIVDTTNGRIGLNVTPIATLDIVAIAQAGALETLAKFKVSDNPAYISFENGTTTDTFFIPVINAYTEDPIRAALIYKAAILPAADTGTAAIVNYQARRSDNTSIVNRILFTWSNFGTVFMQMLASGFLGIGNALTPTERLHVDGNIRTNGNIILPKASGFGFKNETGTFNWRDLRGHIIVRTVGLTSPTYDTMFGNQNGYRFSIGDKIDFDYHYDHDVVAGSDQYYHVHWIHNGTAISGVIWFMVALSYAKGHNQANFPDDVLIPIFFDTVNIATTPARRHRIEEVQMSAAGGLITSAVNVSITTGTAILTAASSLFSPYDAGRTIRVNGAGVAGGVLDTTILSYTSATSVTLATNASTTVTAQPNYRLRVLDTSLLEPDGIVLSNIEQKGIPTITGGSGEPFIIYADIHYLSTGQGTVAKAPNFYV